MGAIKELLKAGIKALVKEEGDEVVTKAAKVGEDAIARKETKQATDKRTGEFYNDLSVNTDARRSKQALELNRRLTEATTRRDRLRAQLKDKVGTEQQYDELSKIESSILTLRDNIAKLTAGKGTKVPPNTGSAQGVGKDVANTNTNTGKPMATKLGVDEYMGKLKQNHANSETRNKERYEEMMKSGLGK